MFGFNSVLSGLLLVALGIGITFTTLYLMRRTPRRKTVTPADLVPPLPIGGTEHDEAILLVRQGGQVLYMNNLAREWFKAAGGKPNLERMSQRAKPTEALLDLCAAQRQASFYLDGQAVDGISYQVPYEDAPAILVALRRPQLVVDEPGSSQSVSRVLRTFTEINQQITSSLELEETLLTILENIKRLTPADYMEISYWDADDQRLVCYRLYSAEKRLEKVNAPSAQKDGYSDILLGDRQPLLITDRESYHRANPLVAPKTYPYHSFLGIPLVFSDEAVGTIELASLVKDGFTQRDLGMLRLFSDQAAIAVHNALLFAEDKRRYQEIAGLTQIAQAVSSSKDSQDLFARLIESITPLIDVEVLGFLIYDENQHILEGKLPFIGFQPSMLAWARFPIPAGSPAEEVWLSQELIISREATSDVKLRLLGLDHLAITAGIQQAVLTPLTTGGRMLGYLLAGDKRDDSAFNPSDIRLLETVTTQAAPIIENASLVQQSQRRAQRAETLRRIASLTSSSATLDEIIRYSLQDLARLLQADKAALFLLDENRGELRLHKDSILGITAEQSARLGRLPTDDPQYSSTITETMRPHLSYVTDEDAELQPVYRSLVTALEMRSLIIAPLIMRERGVGEMILGAGQANFFNPSDVQTVMVAAGQLAAAIEQAKLYNQTDESLRRRVEQLTALTRISRELNSTFDLNHMLQRVFEEALRTTLADCGTILLFELPRNGNQTSPAQLPSPSPNITLQLGDPHGGELHPLERAALERRETVLIQDFEQTIDIRQERRNPLPPSTPAHPGIRSSMVVPITYQEQVAGLIHLHARNPRRFDETSKSIAETLSIQAAIALGNAYRYQEQVHRGELLNRRVDTMSRILEITQAIQPEQTLDQALEKIASVIRDATPFDAVLMSIYEEESQTMQRLVGLGISETDMAELKTHPQAWSSIQKILRPEFSIGGAYFIPYEQMPIAPEELHTVTVLPLDGQATSNLRGGTAWHPDDMFLIPLLDTSSTPLGLISLDAPRDGMRPDLTTIEALQVFASQATFIIDSHKQMRFVGNQLEAVQREYQLSQETQERLPELLHKEIEQTLAIQLLSQRIRRIRDSMDIAEIVNLQKDQSGVLLALGGEILTRLEMDIVLIAESAPHGPRLLYTLGKIPEGVNIEALVGQRNPLLHCLQSGEQLLVSHLDEENAWYGSPLLQAVESKSFISIPIRISNAPLTAVLAIGREAQPAYTEEDEQLFSLLSRLAAISLENLKLIHETSKRLADVNLLLDFNRQLGSLDAAQTLQTLVESALYILPQAQAGMVALWDSKQGGLAPQAAVGYTNNSRLLQISFSLDKTLPGKVYRSAEPLRLDEVDFAVQYELSSENLMHYREATGGRLPVSSMIIPIAPGPQVKPLGVLALDNYTSTGVFSADDQALITSLAQQTALNLENTRLYRAAEQRANQLEALTNAAGAITSWLQLDSLVAALLDQLHSIQIYDTGTLWLLEDGKATVRSARGFADSEERVGLTLDVQDSQLLNEMIQTGQAIYVPDVRKDERFPALLEPERLCWLGVPLISGRKVTGVIALEKSEANFYTSEDIQLAATFAGQAAVALENARLFQDSLDRAFELDQRSQRLEMLNRLSAALSETLDVTHILGTACLELFRAVSCSGVSALLFDAEHNPRLISEYPPTSANLPLFLPKAPLFERLRESLGIFYTEDVTKESELHPLAEHLSTYQTHSLLVLPMVTGNELHGLFLLHSEEPHRFTPDESGLGRTISNQTAIAVQNARLYAETRSLSEELEQRVIERTADLAREHQRSEILLRIITELSASLDLEQVLNRTLLVLNEIMDAEQISVLILREGESKLYHLASAGYIPVPLKENRSTPFSPDQGLAGWVISRRQTAFIPNVLEDDRWVQRPETPSEHRSAVGVPLLIGEQALGALLFFHRQPSHFSPDQLDLVQAAANQVAVAVNNAELYRLIRDQAEDLGKMLREQQIETSRSRAILEAVADGVLVTDAARKITLFNASAERILNLKRSQVIGKTLEHFIGFFGGAAQPWMDTIRTWSQDPTTYRIGDIYEEQIVLEDRRVVSVHLAPVSLRNEFLGTVSIFRDITHQVEVDRLKSEFVATVSHELRTPMTSIKGYVDILLMGAGGNLSEQQIQFLEIVRNNTERLTALVNDLLDISRIETRRITLSLQPINMTELARAATERLSERAKNDHKAMKIQVKASDNLPLVLGDPERVSQILDNLLENSYYYTADNGRIDLILSRVDDEAQVAIRDSGIGIPVELQPRVFERFYRGEHPFVLATSGTGLGLSIVQQLVEMHGGRIWLESSGVPGEGSTFSFTLPLYTTQKPDGSIERGTLQ
jgi:PAS domain S-box-containing protein